MPNTPYPRSAHEDAYQDWISSHAFQRNDGIDFDERIHHWDNAPKFHLAVVHDGGPAQELANSLRSLARQYYPLLVVTIASGLSAPPGVTAGNLTWMQTTDVWRDANRALMEGPQETWVGLLRAGDQLAAHAFLVLAEHIHSHPAARAIYTDEDVCDSGGRRHSARFKPDFDLEFLRSAKYIGGLILATREAWNAAGGWLHLPHHHDELDLALRLTETLGSTPFGHLPDVLYHRSAGHPALARSEEAAAEQLDCVNRHLQRSETGARAVGGLVPGTVRILYPLAALPRVSIIVPTKDQFPLLQRCVESLFAQTDYPDLELLVIDNGSRDPTARAYLDGLLGLSDPRIRVISYDHPFNFSAMNNLAAAEASGELLLLLNNDTAALHREWLMEMVALAQQPKVGIVGARLLHPDGTLQHAGVVLGMAGPAEHLFISHSSEESTRLYETQAVRGYSAVTAACLLIRRDLYLAVGGMDEEALKVAYNDVDLCLKVGAKGQRVLWTPFATLLHEGSASQRSEDRRVAPSEEKLRRFAAEQSAMYQRWMPRLMRDPAYNRNLSLSCRDGRPEPEAVLSWNPTPWNPRPRILVHPVDRAGCGEYRAISPIRALHDARRCRGYASQRFLNPVEVASAGLSTVVVQIPVTERHQKAIETYRTYSDALCIVEIDDLITDVAPDNPQSKHFGSDAIRFFENSLRSSHRLVVPTDALADAFAGLAPEVRVARNYLSTPAWTGVAPARRPRIRPRVGWAGSTSHHGDLALLVEVVRSLAKEVDWVFFGTCRPELQPYLKQVVPAVPFAEYPRALAAMDLDLALAPIANNAFNEAKSPLKLMEYGILGYPVVCSDVGPYRADFPVKRVANTARTWIAAIRERIHDLDATRKEGEILHAHVRDRCMLEDHLDEWLAAWMP